MPGIRGYAMCRIHSVLNFEQITSSFWILFPVTSLPSSLSITTPVPLQSSPNQAFGSLFGPFKEVNFSKWVNKQLKYQIALKIKGGICVPFPLKALLPGHSGLHDLQRHHHFQVSPWDDLGCQRSGASLGLLGPFLLLSSTSELETALGSVLGSLLAIPTSAGISSHLKL